ncbi:cytochrome b5-like heme/steroid binding domain-containing protein [Phycomyces nitens]|nr:cytochrome b5-like heme/steroid binding domain-containing protein [Phycomyces nitens]
MASVYSLKDVSKHNTKADMWVVIHNKVYDISSFVPDHPGSEDILINRAAGKDATEAFEDINHSELARETLEQFIIGQLHEDDCVVRKVYESVYERRLEKEKPGRS